MCARASLSGNNRLLPVVIYTSPSSADINVNSPVVSASPPHFLARLPRPLACFCVYMCLYSRFFPHETFLSDADHDRMYSRSASPPENGFKEHVETRLYRSQGKGPTRTERTPHLGGRSAQQPARSQPKAQAFPPPSGGGGGGGGHRSRRLDRPVNGYDTDSSQDSREHPGSGGGGRSRPSRPWKPMREVLNVDSVLSGGHAVHQDRRQHSPKRRPSSESPTRNRDADLTWGSREERKPKSLMTIYEDEQRHETGGSRSSLDSDGRAGYGDKDRSKGSATLKTRGDNWRIQRTESGYESSDRLSNGSANLDSPVVENLRPGPEQHLPR